MALRLVLTVLVSLLARSALADIQPFTTDGCSAFPDGTPEQQDLWLNCCVRHDRAYWKGGTHEERVLADEALRECVALVGEPEISELMLLGVRVGGTPYLPTKFRWGYGWPFFRGYKPVNDAEMKQIEAQE